MQPGSQESASATCVKNWVQRAGRINTDYKLAQSAILHTGSLRSIHVRVSVCPSTLPDLLSQNKVALRTVISPDTKLPEKKSMAHRVGAGDQVDSQVQLGKKLFSRCSIEDPRPDRSS